MKTSGCFLWRACVSSTLVAWGCGGEPVGPKIEPAPEAQPANETSLSFEPGETLSLMPGDRASFGVRLTPPVTGTVRFSLLDDHGDAALEQSSVGVAADGWATTRLYAPRQAATFRIKALHEQGGATAERAVSVSGAGFATLVVTPTYNGKRSLTTWVATVDASGQRCSDSSAQPPDDGPLQIVGALGAMIVPEVPAGQPLRVTVRSQGLAGGCIDIDPVVAGETRKVKVAAINVPARITPTSLDVTLSLAGLDAASPSGTQGTWASLVTAWADRFTSSFFGGAAKPAVALLDTMAMSLPEAQRVAFQAARSDKGWDAAVTKAWGKSAGLGALSTWVEATRASLQQAPGSIRARLTASTSTPEGKALFAPQSIFSISTASGDELGSRVVTWGSEPDDRVTMGGEVSFSASRLFAREIELIVGSGVTNSLSVPPAVMKSARCADVAAALLVGAVASLPACTSKCLVATCEAAVTVMWARARDRDLFEGAAVGLQFAASADALLDASARVVGFQGTWVGSASDSAAGATSQFMLKGAVKGATPK